MKLTINPVGRCSKSNHQQYSTQTEALQVANAYKSTVSFEVYQCPHCGYWELKKKQYESADVSNFLEEPTDPITEAKKLLEDNGYGVIPPEKYHYVFKVLSAFKNLRNELGLVFKDEGEGDK